MSDEKPPEQTTLEASGWACFAPSGAISWRSVETSREASLELYLGSHWREHWPQMEAAGSCCVQVRITECTDA